ncbi:MAG TPA: ABC transporter permease [Streptosporangiaceae bacterium]|jgi:peptide/nickel transport system permease protein|nr:ABC transporter permease [Streptosporangiaceae bacterium]
MAFLTFLIRRLLLGIIVMWFVTVATFLLFFVAPQDPARLLAGKNPTPQTIAAINARLGLNQPLIVQYGHYVDRLVHGNLGTSFVNGSSVNTILKQDLPPTLSLLVGGVILWLIVGLGAGILSATRVRTLVDRTSTVGVLIGITFPTFVLGLLLQFAIFLPLNRSGFHWVQTGYEGPTTSIVGWAGHMILPWITIAAVSAATYTRLTRGSLLDTMGEDYIRTARSKGLTERRVLYRHAIRAALTPVVSQLGVDMGTLAGGAVVTEQVFGLGGIGQQSLTSITTGDTPVVLGIVLMAALFVVVANIVVDVLYSVLDPRVKLS